MLPSGAKSDEGVRKELLQNTESSADATGARSDAVFASRYASETSGWLGDRVVNPESAVSGRFRKPLWSAKAGHP